MPLTSVSLSCGRFVFRFSEVEFVPRAPEFRQVIPSTKCRCSTLHWATGAALWIPGKGLPLAFRAGVVTLHPTQGASPLDTPASKSNAAFRGYARQMQAFAVASRPAASLRTPSKGLSLASCAGVVTLHPPHGRCPLDSRQGSYPLHPAQALRPAPGHTKKRYRFDTAFCVDSPS